MDELEKLIAGDLYEIRQLAPRFFAVQEYFGFSDETVQSVIDALRLSADAGIVGFKENVLNEIFFALEESQFQAISRDDLTKHKRSADTLLLVTVLQRLFALGYGRKTNTEPEQPSPETASLDDVEISKILADVRERVRRQPEYQTHPAVKSIFVQVKRYQRELYKMMELGNNIKGDKKATFFRNFQQTFNGISENIRRNYSVLIGEDVQETAPNRVTQVMEAIRIKDLVPLFGAQIREISRIRATLQFGLEGGMKLREAFNNLWQKQSEITRVFALETKRYREVSRDAGIHDEQTADSLGKSFANEAINSLERHFLAGASSK